MITNETKTECFNKRCRNEYTADCPKCGAPLCSKCFNNKKCWLCKQINESNIDDELSKVINITMRYLNDDANQSKGVKMGNYKYLSNGTTRKGSFNIYQAKNGAIYILIGNNAVPFTLDQINKLYIDCYSLEDFDIDKFNQYYIDDIN